MIEPHIQQFHAKLMALRLEAVKNQRFTPWQPHHAVLPNGQTVRWSALMSQRFSAAELFQSPQMDDDVPSTKLLIASYVKAAHTTTRVLSMFTLKGTP